MKMKTWRSLLPLLLLGGLQFLLLLCLLLLDKDQLDGGELLQSCAHQGRRDLVTLSRLHHFLVFLMEDLEGFRLVTPCWEILLLTGTEWCRLGDAALDLPLTLELRNEPRRLHDELLFCALAFCGCGQLLQHRDVTRRGLLGALHRPHQRCLRHQLPPQRFCGDDSRRVSVFPLGIFDRLGQGLVHWAKVVEVRDRLHLHYLAELDLRLELGLDLRALVYQLAIHRLVLRQLQCRGDGLELIQMQRRGQLMLSLLDRISHLHTPGNRLLLLRRFRGLVDIRLKHRRLREHVQRPRAKVSQHGG
mmetsp:Transcript_92936/g.258850  ORF Transcript_92936/g.258850 Transcript_92936/m.258850 type:complete len:303 (+) Transcript_92936:61-969(+)